MPSRLSSSLAFALVLHAASAAGAAGSAEGGEWPLGDPSDAEAYPRVELITMGIGSLMWERHGHIALCIRWPEPRRDRCYNYGVADFHDPVGMGMAFFRAKKSFWVEAQSPESMFSIYVNADRTVWMQRLPLTPEQKNKVIEKLSFDVKKENRYYAYDHFFDNCTTRVRDVLDNAIGGTLKAVNRDLGDATIRDYARKGFYGMRWALVITDLFMGRVTDKVPSHWELMFLPDYLRAAFEVEFGVPAVVLYQRVGPPPLESAPSGRFIFFLLILLVTAPAWITRLVGRFERAGMIVSLVLPVFLGLVYWIGAIVSPVSYVRWNEAFFIFMPFDAALAFFGRKRIRDYARFRVAGLLIVSALLAVGLFRQPLWIALFWPLIPCAVVASRPVASAPRQAEAEADEEE